MRSLILACVLAACGGGTDPRVIAGGGIGDGDIDGEVFVHVIDSSTDAPLANVMVEVAGVMKTTDAKDFVEFGDVDGPQTINVKLQGYRMVSWVGANGKNVTIPIEPLTVNKATLSGSIPGWDQITVPAQHIKAAIVFYSQTDTIGDPANDIDQNNMNICGVLMNTCNWTLTSRTGTVTVYAGIIDRDTKGTAGLDDDTQTIIGWATKTGIVVDTGVNQSNIMLTQVEAGNLETLTVNYGTPPASLTVNAAFVGIEVTPTEFVQIPIFDGTTVVAPKAAVFNSTSTKLRLAAVAQTTSGDNGAQAISLQRDLARPTLTVTSWLSPPTGVAATRTTASWTPVSGAKIHSVEYREVATKNVLLGITVFDSTASVAVPPLLAIPAAGAIQARVQALAADLDVQDFSLEEDADKLRGIAVEPVSL